MLERMTRLVGCGLLLLLLAPGAARADEDAKGRAGRLVEEGIAAYQAGDPRGALSRFREAYDLYPSPKIHLNLALALEQVGREFEAAEHYDRFLTETASEEVSRDKRAAALAALRRLEPRVARLRLAFDGAAPASLVVNGEARPIRPGRPVHVAPGMVSLEARAEGYQPAAWRGELIAGEERVVRLVFSPSPAATPPPARDAARIEVARPAPAPPRRRRVWTWVAAGAAAALAAGGTVMWLRTGDAYESYQDAPDDETWQRRREVVESRQTWTRALYVGAGAAAVAAGVLFVVEGAPREPGVALAPRPGGGILAIDGRF